MSKRIKNINRQPNPVPNISKQKEQKPFSVSFKNLLTEITTKNFQMYELKEFFDKLKILSSLDWDHISNLSYQKSHGSEFINIHQLKKNYSVLDKIEKLMCFKFSDSGRFLGLREGNIFHVYIITAKHDAY